VGLTGQALKDYTAERLRRCRRDKRERERAAAAIARTIGRQPRLTPAAADTLATSLAQQLQGA
jgi:hypothetical protein